MTLQIPDRESETVEFKSTFQDKVIETLVAFANTQGGTVYIGLSDDGNIQGIKIGKETIQQWINEIKQKTQPSIIPTIKRHTINGKTVVLIDVQEFPVKPLSFKGRYYKRINNSNHQLSTTEITDMNLRSLQLSWDAYPKQGKTLSDLDIQKIDTFIEKINNAGRFRLSGNREVDLQKLKLISDKAISNAAWLSPKSCNRN